MTQDGSRGVPRGGVGVESRQVLPGSGAPRQRQFVLCNTITRRAWGLGFTDATLAERVGITRVQMNRIRNARAIPGVATALAVADALGCRVSDLFTVRRDRS